MAHGRHVIRRGGAGVNEALRKEIAAEALVSCGEGIGWQALLQKKPLRIAYLGGSVTQGYADGEIRFATAFPAVVERDLRARGAEIRSTVVAEPGMDSLICGLLAETEIIPHAPDLVFLEFAINDTTLRHNVHSFESLLRRMLELPSHPAVCLLIMRSVSDYSCESFMLPMAEHYALPCIDLRRGLAKPLSEGRMIWTDFADNESHPHEAGHRLLADCVLHLLDTAAAQPQTAQKPLPEPWLDVPFLHMHRLTPGDYPGIETQAPVVGTGEWFFSEAWELSERPGCGMTIRMNCRAAVICFETHHLEHYGSCRVTVDGKPAREPLRSNSIYGWGNPRHMIVLQAEEPGEHVIELMPFDGIFRVLSIGVTD